MPPPAPVAPAYLIWAHYAHGWQRRCQEDPVGLPSGRLEKTTGSSPHHMAQHHPTGSETPPYAPRTADLAQNRPLWRMMSTYGATQSWVACQKRRRPAPEALCFCFVSFCPVFRPLLSILLSLRKNTEGFWWNSWLVITIMNSLNDNVLNEIRSGAEYDRKFTSTSIGFSAMPIRCWSVNSLISLHGWLQMQSHTQFLC